MKTEHFASVALLAVYFLAGCASTKDEQRPSIATIDGLAGLQAPARVVVDRYGIPHIYASSRVDAAFVLGWIHARDRFLQMDIYRRSGSGKLAALLGPSAIEEDHFVRTLGLHDAARRAWDRHVPIRERAILTSYATGVNTFLARAAPEELPSYYRDHNLEPEPWLPSDALAIHKRFTLELSHSFDDLYLQLVAERLGHDAAEELFPFERDSSVPVIRDPVRSDFMMRLQRRSSGTPVRRPVATAREESDPRTLVVTPPPVDGLSKTCEELLARFGNLPRRIASPRAFASNAWAVSGARSLDNAPILAHDPHFALNHPSMFYTAHLDSPGVSVIGATIPGIPAVVFGHNGSIAWTTANSRADVIDFFVETLNPEDPNFYRFRGRSLQIRRVEEEIKVLGQESVRFEVRRTVHGPILTAYGQSVAVKWTGSRATAEIVSLLQINVARNLQSFLDALRPWVAPPMAFVYGDVEGRIAARVTGDIPRRTQDRGRYPLDGASGKYEWRFSPIPFEEMPLSVNPSSGVIVAANQRLTAPNPHGPLGWQFDASFRARRVDSVLSSSRRFTPRHMRQLQLDARDLCIEQLVAVVVEAFATDAPTDRIADIALRRLRAWNSRFDADAVEPTIAWTWFKIFADSVWEDEWEKAGIPRDVDCDVCANGWQPPFDVLVRLALDDPDAQWFDDIRTPEREGRDAIVRRSFLAAIKLLTEQLGPGISGWRWGRRNRMIIPDLLRTPDGALDLGPVPGSPNTVSPGGNGGAVSSGAAYRIVLPLADLATARGAAPGIQARPLRGHNTEATARRQALAYLNGTYFPLLYYSFPGDFPESEVGALAILSPKWADRDRGGSIQRPQHKK